jgi:hypothetical protein
MLTVHVYTSLKSTDFEVPPPHDPYAQYSHIQPSTHGTCRCTRNTLFWQYVHQILPIYTRRRGEISSARPPNHHACMSGSKNSIIPLSHFMKHIAGALPTTYSWNHKLVDELTTWAAATRESSREAIRRQQCRHQPRT